MIFIFKRGISRIIYQNIWIIGQDINYIIYLQKIIKITILQRNLIDF